MATFVYDGDNNRVKSTVNGVTTAYVGAYFEVGVPSGATTKYYYLGNQRIAMRTPSAVYYVVTDDPSFHSGQAWDRPP